MWCRSRRWRTGRRVRMRRRRCGGLKIEWFVEGRRGVRGRQGRFRHPSTRRRLRFGEGVGFLRWERPCGRLRHGRHDTLNHWLGNRLHHRLNDGLDDRLCNGLDDRLCEQMRCRLGGWPRRGFGEGIYRGCQLPDRWPGCGLLEGMLRGRDGGCREWFRHRLCHGLHERPRGPGRCGCRCGRSEGLRSSGRCGSGVRRRGRLGSRRSCSSGQWSGQGSPLGSGQWSRLGSRRTPGGRWRVDAFQQVLVPVVRQQIVARQLAAGLERHVPGGGWRQECILQHWPMVGLGGAVEGRLARLGAQRIEIVRQLRRRHGGAEAGGRPFAERLAHGRRRSERVLRERIGERAGAARGRRGAKPRAAAEAGLRHGFVGQPHLDLIGADGDAVAIAQLAYRLAADRRRVAIEGGAVGGGVGDLPVAAAICDGEMVFGEQSLGIGQDPVHARAAADAELAAHDRAGLRRYGIGATQDGEGQGHGGVILSPRRGGCHCGSETSGDVGEKGRRGRRGRTHPLTGGRGRRGAYQR